jgi:hypothetical protein
MQVMKEYWEVITRSVKNCQQDGRRNVGIERGLWEDNLEKEHANKSLH